jgi:type VI secretion system secreted protein Hcp
MFLWIPGVTGEAVDASHKGEIEVVKWSWGLESPREVATGQARGRTKFQELEIEKRVDQATATLMGYLKSNKPIDKAKLTVRKAGKEPLEYFTIELNSVRITSVKTESENFELTEKVTIGFNKVTVTYTPQGGTGAKGGGANVFEAEAHSVA